MMSNLSDNQAPIQFPPPTRERMIPQVSDGDQSINASGVSQPIGYNIAYDTSIHSQHPLMQHQPESFHMNIQSNLQMPQTEGYISRFSPSMSLGLSQVNEVLDENSLHKKLPTPNKKRKSVSSTQVKKSRSSTKKMTLSIPQASAKSALDALAFACAAEQDFNMSKVSSTSQAPPVNSTRTKKNEDATNRPSTNQNLVNEKVAVDAQDSFGSSSISHNDVLCGRGGLTNHHPGNIFFRRMVRLRQESYLRASKRDKASVARDIVDTIRQLNPPGRFLKKGGDVWVEIGNRKAREKTSQALREGAPELREELQQTAQGNSANSDSQLSSSSPNMAMFTEEQRMKLRMEEGQKVVLPFSRDASLDDAAHTRLQATSLLTGHSNISPMQQMQVTPNLITDEKNVQSHTTMQIQNSGNLPHNYLYYPDVSQYPSNVIQGAKSLMMESHSNSVSINTTFANQFGSINESQPTVIRSSSDEESGSSNSPRRKNAGPRLKMLKNRMGTNRV